MITLLGRAGCHLCDEAHDVLAPLAAELGVELTERDVDSDPRLARRFGSYVPVVLVAGDVIGYHRVDPDRVRTAVAAAASG